MYGHDSHEHFFIDYLQLTYSISTQINFLELLLCKKKMFLNMFEDDFCDLKPTMLISLKDTVAAK